MTPLTAGSPAEQRDAAPLGLGDKISIWPPVVLAPMAGVTNYPYRRICSEHGAGLCVAEMVSSRGILEGSRKTWHLAHFGEEERPRSIQIFGCDPGAMGDSARKLREELDVDHIDINFGCPVQKLVRKGMGAAAVLDAKNFRRVVAEVVRGAGDVPVTIKVRIGLDEERHTYLEAGRVAEGEGCAWIALHARTAAQMYSGAARWEHIARLKSAVSIPVLGNGDIFEAPDALEMMAETGCDGVVIGRGCLGNPWLFRNLERVFTRSSLPERPKVPEIVRVIREHFDLLTEHNHDCPKIAALQMRKFGTWYIKGIQGAASLRTEFQRIQTKTELEGILERVVELDYEHSVRSPAEPTRVAAR